MLGDADVRKHPPARWVRITIPARSYGDAASNNRGTRAPVGPCEKGATMKRPILRVLTWGGVGDALLNTAAFRAWKERNPGGRLIVYCATRMHHDILRGNPHITSLRQMYRWRFALRAFPFGRRWMQ